jgi:hypothetical protein
MVSFIGFGFSGLWSDLPPELGDDLSLLGSDLPVLGSDLPVLGSGLPVLGSSLPVLGSDLLGLGRWRRSSRFRCLSPGTSSSR